MRFINGLWYLLVTLFYLGVVVIGIGLSYPMVIIVIAWQTALDSTEKIRKHLN
jgi:hypothetical protein